MVHLSTDWNTDAWGLGEGCWLCVGCWCRRHWGDEAVNWRKIISNLIMEMLIIFKYLYHPGCLVLGVLETLSLASKEFLALLFAFDLELWWKHCLNKCFENCHPGLPSVVVSGVTEFILHKSLPFLNVGAKALAGVIPCLGGVALLGHYLWYSEQLTGGRVWTTAHTEPLTLSLFLGFRDWELFPDVGNHFRSKTWHR